MKALADKATPIALDADAEPTTPTLILSVDQGEELFLAEGQDEAQAFLVLLHDLLIQDTPAIIAVFTIRSDNYERLQLVKELEGLRQHTFSLPPMPRGSYAEVIKGPAQRLARTERPLEVEDTLANTLLTDIEAGSAKDALPLLAFTLERLYVEHGGDGDLTVAEYRSLGGITGSIEAAVERALKAADADPAIPKDPAARLALLRHGLIPWLAGIDPDTGAPRRRVARLSEIPVEARPLIQHLIEQRLLATDVSKDTGEKTIEPAHEALLRQWGLLQGWLTEDAGLLAVLEGVKRASRDWAANNRDRAWLTHVMDRLVAAERLSARPDLSANLEPTDRAYLASCRQAEADAKGRKRRVQALVGVFIAAIIAGLAAWWKQDWVKERLYELENVHVLAAAKERVLKPEDSFKECTDCPEMVVVPAGSFMMGSPAGQGDDDEHPQHNVTIAKPFAVSKFELTFEQWDACVADDGCNRYIPPDHAWGRGRQPAIYVSWDDAQEYVAWLTKLTGRQYRLLTEAEYEYGARAGKQTAYPWGDQLGTNNANCAGCGSKWDGKQPAPVGSFHPNGFGLYDMVGNVSEWVEDCYLGDYSGAPVEGHADYHPPPTDGSAWDDCGPRPSRDIRGGSWNTSYRNLRSAHRFATVPDYRVSDLGFRVARTVDH